MSGNNTDSIFDASVLTSLQEAIGDSVNNIINIYLDDFPRNIADMKAALVKHEYDTIGRLAHSLKSSSGNLGASELVKLAADLEAYMRQPDPDDQFIAKSIDALEQGFAKIHQQLVGFIR